MRALALVLLLALPAAAQDAPKPESKPEILHFEQGVSIALPPPRKPLDLPPGYYLPVPAMQSIDTEMKRLQGIEAEKQILEVNASRAVIIAACVSAVLGAGLTAAVLWSTK